MFFDSFICRKNLDEERGNSWICECPMCQQLRKEIAKARLSKMPFQGRES